VLEMQRTVGLVKPGVLDRGAARAAVRAAAERANLTVVAWRELRVSQELAERFYASHRGRFFYQRLVLFLSHQSVDAFVLEGEDAVAKVLC
jgi:nucleoside-diphosphate kinase